MKEIALARVLLPELYRQCHIINTDPTINLPTYEQFVDIVNQRVFLARDYSMFNFKSMSLFYIDNDQHALYYPGCLTLAVENTLKRIKNKNEEYEWRWIINVTVDNPKEYSGLMYSRFMIEPDLGMLCGMSFIDFAEYLQREVFTEAEINYARYDGPRRCPMIFVKNQIGKYISYDEFHTIIDTAIDSFNAITTIDNYPEVEALIKKLNSNIASNKTDQNDTCVKDGIIFVGKPINKITRFMDFADQFWLAKNKTDGKIDLDINQFKAEVMNAIYAKANDGIITNVVSTDSFVAFDCAPNLYPYSKINSDNKFEVTFESTPVNPIGPDEKVPDYKWYSFYFNSAEFMRVITNDKAIKDLPDPDLCIDTILTKIAKTPGVLTNIDKIDSNKFHIVSTKEKWEIKLSKHYGDDDISQRFIVK